MADPVKDRSGERISNQDLFQDPDHPVDLLFRNCQGRHETKGVGTRRIQEESPGERLLDDPGPSVRIQAHGQKKSLSANPVLARPRRKLLKAYSEIFSLLPDPFQKLPAAHDLEDRQSCRHGQGIPVEGPPWSPFSKQQTGFLAVRAPRGNPPPIPFPRVMISGRSRLFASEKSPRTPHSRLYLVQYQQDPFPGREIPKGRRYSREAGITPASPWIGSSMTATVRSVKAFRTASMSFRGTLTKSGTLCSKRVSHCGFPEADIVARVRPWKELCIVMISRAPDR